MDGSVADIIRAFASYLEIIIGYIKDFFSAFLKKDQPAEETTTA